MTRCFVAGKAVSGGGVPIELTRCALPVKCEDPARTPGLSLCSITHFLCSIAYYFKYTGLTITHLPSGRKFDLVWMVDCGRVLHRFGGLTTNRRSQQISKSAVSGQRSAEQWGEP